MKKFLVGLTVLAALLPALGSAAQLLVLNKSDATLSFIDPESGKTSTSIPTGEGPHEIELSSDGRLAFVSNYGARVAGNTLSVIDAAARKELHRVDWTFETDQGRTHMVIASRDGSKLFASNMGSNTISVIERGADDEWQQTLIRVGEGPEAIDLPPDGRELWTAHSGDGGVSIIDPVRETVIETFDVQTERSNRLKFTPDGRLVLISDLSGGELVILDARKRTERARLKIGSSPTGILIPNNEQAYVAVSGNDHIAVIDLKTLDIAKTIKTGDNPDGMAWMR